MSKPVEAPGRHVLLKLSVPCRGIVRGLALTSELGDALQKSDVFQRSTWDLLAPSGKVNVVMRIEQTNADRPGRPGEVGAYIFSVEDGHSPAGARPSPPCVQRAVTPRHHTSAHLTYRVGCPSFHG